MWIDTTQVYGFSNPDEWREAKDFAENLKKSNVPFLWKEDTNTIRVIVTDCVRGKMNSVMFIPYMTDYEDEIERKEE